MTGSANTTPESHDGPLAITAFEEFAALYRQAYPRLTLIAAAITNDASHAEDVVQDAALIAIAKVDQYESGSNFAAWMAAIVRRCALNHRRKVRARKTFAANPASLVQQADPSAEVEPSWVGVGATGQIPAHQADFDDELLHALSALSEVARCCLLLRVVERLSYAEIAELLEIPAGTAMSHVHRSKHLLRKQLLVESSGSSPAVSRES